MSSNKNNTAGVATTVGMLLSEPNSSSSGPNTPSNRKSGSPSLYACGDCGRRYSRPEHLQRHVQAHAFGRRFECSICGKAFARADLRKRHEANHDNDASKKRRRTAAAVSSNRVGRACKPCAAARVKCQDEKPCQRCRSRGLDCMSSEAGASAAHLVYLDTSIAQSSRLSPVSTGESVSPNPSTSTGIYIRNSIEPWSNTLVKVEESQEYTLNTTTEDGQAGNHQATSYPTAANSYYTSESENLSFSEFLRDVLYEQNLDQARTVGNPSLEVLDFCGNDGVEMSDMDFGMLNDWDMDAMSDNPMQTQKDSTQEDSTVGITEMRQNLVQVWAQSSLRWDPHVPDSSYTEQDYLPVQIGDATNAQFQQRRKRLETLVQDKLEQPVRDGVLTMVLSVCQPRVSHVASAFPSSDVMDTLIHIFLNSHACQVSQWIHFPTLRFSEQFPEWVANAAAAGCLLTPFPTLRRFGLALQESVRTALPKRFEEDTARVHSLSLLQALILGLDIGLWSGNRRKMEIAECHLLIPITMMRYRCKFQRASYPMIHVDPADEGEVLESKWKRWVEMEHWKRLVFHCYLRDAQSSMTTLINPSISYFDLTLPLPESRTLWYKKTAAEWKLVYLERHLGRTKRPPSVADLFFDIKILAEHRHRIDVQAAVSIYLHGFWALLIEYHALCKANRWRTYTHTHTPSTTSTMLLRSRHEEVVRDLHKFQVFAVNYPEISAQEQMVLNLLLMALHISLDDLQLFAGKEGEDQARRVYPVLQQWVNTAEARSAIWYAGQVLRHAKASPPGSLKDFYAVAVHYAALTLWTYGVVARASRRQPALLHPEPIYLDGFDGMASLGSTSLGPGQLFIHASTAGEETMEASIEDARMCMEVVQEVLKGNFLMAQDGLPPIVENICQLIRQLGNAAWDVGLG